MMFELVAQYSTESDRRIAQIKLTSSDIPFLKEAWKSYEKEQMSNRELISACVYTPEGALLECFDPDNGNVWVSAAEVQ